MEAGMEHDGAGEIRRLLDDASAALAAAGVENPRLDAELLLAQATQASRPSLISGSVTLGDFARNRYAAMLKRRAAREPLAYILGRKEFYSIEFEVTPAVLIPRPETETIVAAALEFLASRAASRVLDIGTGCGAIVIAIAANAAGTQVVATDISPNALAVARRNATRLGSRIDFRRADCFDVIDGGEALGQFDLVVSNPPYICDQEIERLQPEISRFEPRRALAGGADGMYFYRRIVRGIRDHLAPDGAVIVEVGDSQSRAVAEIFRGAGLGAITMLADLTEVPRAVRAQWAARSPGN
jgi:release factor glutamine methyltransferase